MFCSSCGKQIPDGSNVCPYCGASMMGGVNMAQPVMQPSSYDMQPKKGKGGIIAAIIIFVFVAAAAVFVCVFWKPWENGMRMPWQKASLDGTWVANIDVSDVIEDFTGEELDSKLKLEVYMSFDDDEFEIGIDEEAGDKFKEDFLDIMKDVMIEEMCDYYDCDEDELEDYVDIDDYMDELEDECDPEDLIGNVSCDFYEEDGSVYLYDGDEDDATEAFSYEIKGKKMTIEIEDGFGELDGAYVDYFEDAEWVKD